MDEKEAIASPHGEKVCYWYILCTYVYIAIFILYQEFIDELSYLMSVSKHPRTLNLLQDALDCTRNKVKEANNVNGVAYKEETSVAHKSECVKSSITSWNTTRVKDYGK